MRRLSERDGASELEADNRAHVALMEAYRVFIIRNHIYSVPIHARPAPSGDR